MVTTRARAAGTQPKVQPKASKDEKAAKAASIKAEKEKKNAEKAAAKAVNDAKKAATKAANDAKKAAEKAEKDANRAAAKAVKAANTKKTTKGTPAAKTKATRVAKVTRVTKSTRKAKATKSKVQPATVKAPKNQYNEDEDEDEDEENQDHVPQAKRRKIVNPTQNLYVEMSPPKEKRPALIIGKWEYMRRALVPQGMEDEDNKPLPLIYIGGNAPQPRWVITQSKSIQVPLKRKASDTISRDFGDLQWTFEEGDFKNWEGLEFQPLYELAYLCLEYTLTDQEFREQIYQSLSQGPLPKAVSVGDKWYPALPPMPVTRHFATGSSGNSSRKSSDATFYYHNFQRPNMAVRQHGKPMRQSYPNAVASNIYDRPRMEEWPTASRSPSPDPGNKLGSKQDGKRNPSVDSGDSPVIPHPYLERNPEDINSEPTTPTSLENEQNPKQDSEQDSERSQSVDSRRSSVTGDSDLERNQEDTYSEPTTPVPLGNDEKILQIDAISQDGSIFGDDDDLDNDVQVESNSARGSREQSPNSLFSGSGSDNEVSASSKTKPSKVNAADDNSAETTNSPSLVSHNGLFSPGQIERYYGERPSNFESLGGVEHNEASEQKRQAQPPPNSEGEVLETLEGPQEEAEIRGLEIRGVSDSSKRVRTVSPSTPSPPASRRKTAAEIRVDNVMSFAGAGQAKRDKMRAAAAEKISDKPPLALLKKSTGNKAGARSQADAPSPEIQPHLQDGFLEQIRTCLKDPIQRARHFPDPIAVRRTRVWAGEELVGHEIKPTVDGTIPPWAERHRPFSQWQDPVSASSIEIFENNADHNRLEWNNPSACGAHKGLEIEKTEQGPK
ncbi:unnamed protein product [Penicillium glandicola]